MHHIIPKDRGWMLHLHFDLHRHFGNLLRCHEFANLHEQGPFLLVNACRSQSTGLRCRNPVKAETTVWSEWSCDEVGWRKVWSRKKTHVESPAWTITVVSMCPTFWCLNDVNLEVCICEIPCMPNPPWAVNHCRFSKQADRAFVCRMPEARSGTHEAKSVWLSLVRPFPHRWSTGQALACRWLTGHACKDEIKMSSKTCTMHCCMCVWYQSDDPCKSTSSSTKSIQCLDLEKSAPGARCLGIKMCLSLWDPRSGSPHWLARYCFLRHWHKWMDQ